jgi:transposase InsO family protein
MLQIHPCARTTPAVRAEIARSKEPTGALARRYGVSTETVRKWRKRGPGDCLDHSARPHRLPWKASEEERAVVCAVRRATRFALDDLTFALRHFLPHLNRHSIWRILRAEGLHRLADLPPAYPDQRPKKGKGRFRDYDLGFVHVDIKQLPKLHVGGREFRKRHLYIAIEPRGIGGSASDRRSRSVHLAVKEDMTAPSATAFLREAAAAFPFRLTRVLTDRGPCFTTGAFAKACAALGAQHRTTRPYTPQTNGMAERFNGRIEREVLTITVGSHRDLERLLKGYNQAYTARPQRVLKGETPNEVARGRLADEPKLANPRHKPPDPTVMAEAMRAVQSTKEVSRPDN